MGFSLLRPPPLSLFRSFALFPFLHEDCPSWLSSSSQPHPAHPLWLQWRGCGEAEAGLGGFRFQLGLSAQSPQTHSNKPWWGPVSRVTLFTSLCAKINLWYHQSDPSIYPSIHPSIYLSSIIHSSICLSIHLSVNLSVPTSILPSIHLSTHSSIHPFICPSFYSSIHPSGQKTSFFPVILSGGGGRENSSLTVFGGLANVHVLGLLLDSQAPQENSPSGPESHFAWFWRTFKWIFFDSTGFLLGCVCRLFVCVL